MTDAMAQPCATCKWAQFEMTKHTPPRINSKHYGQCNWPVPAVVPVARSMKEFNRTHKSCIWPPETGCPVWEAR